MSEQLARATRKVTRANDQIAELRTESKLLREKVDQTLIEYLAPGNGRSKLGLLGTCARPLAAFSIHFALCLSPDILFFSIITGISFAPPSDTD